MKINYWLVIFNIMFLFCVMDYSTSLAQENLQAIVKKIEPSVVVIYTYDKNGKSVGQGSGFFISAGGDVITNRHVLKGSARAEVKISETKVYPISHIVAEDKEGDIVRVSVAIKKDIVRPLPLSISSPEAGEKIIVIGCPLGLEKTVSDGIVSAVREIPAFGKIIQITAPISRGSSGSPVVNMKGEVIGIATFQMVDGQNLNFVVPAERITKLTIEKGKTFAEWEAGIEKEELASAEKHFNKGLNLLFADEYDKALPYFAKALKENPRYVEAYFYIGYCKDELGHYAEAIDANKQAISIKPDYAEAYYNLGVVYDKLGSNTDAVEAFNQAIRIKPDFVETYYNLGVVYSRLGHYNDAVGAHMQAISINPDYAEAHYNLGNVYGKLGRNTEEIEAYKQAIRIKPDYEKAHYNLGVAYGKLERYTEAIEAFKQAIRIEPDFVEAHNSLGLSYGNLRRDADAVEAFKQAIHIKPDYAEAHYNLGIAYLLVGDNGSALDEYKILKNLNKDFANKLFNLIYE